MKRILLLELLTVVALAVNAQSTVTDCQGHTYPVVKIGSQYWIAENLQCTKYDTQSEMAGQVLTSASHGQMAPFYNDPKNVTTEFCDYITAEHRKKFGLLYNYAAAMGFDAYQANAQEGTYQGRRQGICPNGFHIPGWSEFISLGEYCGGAETAGTKLKSTTGWNKDIAHYVPSTNSTGFSALPVDCLYAEYNEVTKGFYGFFGANAEFLTTDVLADDLVHWATLGPESNFYIHPTAVARKTWGVSVRCIKD